MVKADVCGMTLCVRHGMIDRYIPCDVICEWEIGKLRTVGIMVLAGSSVSCNSMGRLHIKPFDDYAPYERGSEPGKK